MILLCDEDVGTGVPTALAAVGYEARSLVGMSWGGRPDEFWLTIAGRREWLVLSCNKRMLKVVAERNTIVRERVGIVFLTTGEEHPPKVFLQLLKKWADLELLWDTIPRPFARFLSSNNRLSDKFRDYRLHQPGGQE